MLTDVLVDRDQQQRVTCPEGGALGRHARRRTRSDRSSRLGMGLIDIITVSCDLMCTLIMIRCRSIESEFKRPI